MKNRRNFAYKVYEFYREGFKSMTVGKTLWTIIFIKLFVMFVILKIFFFKDYLDQNTSNDGGKPGFVLEHLTK